MIRKFPYVVALAVAICLLVPVAAQANTLLTVGQVQGHPTATWSLYSEPGNQETSAAIEISTSPLTGSDGSFFFENVKVFDIPGATDTSYTDSFQLDPGTYYVHVETFNATFYTGSYAYWSNMLVLVIPAPPVPPPAPPVVVNPPPPPPPAVVPPVAHTTIRATLSVKYIVAGSVVLLRPSSTSPVKYTLTRKDFRKVLTTRGNAIFKHLKRGKYTLRSQRLGEIIGTTTYTPSAVVVKHFTIR